MFKLWCERGIGLSQNLQVIFILKFARNTLHLKYSLVHMLTSENVVVFIVVSTVLTLLTYPSAYIVAFKTLITEMGGETLSEDS